MTLTPELIWQSRTWLYVSVQNRIVKRIANFIRISGQLKLIHLHQMWNYIILSTLLYEILIIFPTSASTDKGRLHGYFRRVLYDWLSQQQTTLLGSSKIFKFTLLLQRFLTILSYSGLYILRKSWKIPVHERCCRYSVDWYQTFTNY